MLYPVLTVIVGIPIAVAAFISFARNLKSNGPISAPLRFLVFGIVLTAHFPLTRALRDSALAHFNEAGAETLSAEFAHWASVVVVVAFQLAILPTFREVFTGLTGRKSEHYP